MMFFQHLALLMWTGYLTSRESLQSGPRECTSHMCFEQYMPDRVRYVASDTPCYECVMCNCGDKCVEYGDCCSSTANVSSSENHSRGLSYECVGIQTKEAEREQHYYMVTKCSQGSDIEIRNKCLQSEERNIHSWLPVKAKRNGESWVTYRNQYCAFCNEVLPSEIRPWEFYIKCEQHPPVVIPRFRSLEDIELFVYEHSNCEFEYDTLPGIPETKCEQVPHHVAECNVTGKWDSYNGTIERRCRDDFLLLRVNSILFKNKYCYICNTDGSDNLLQETLECVKESLLPLEIVPGLPPLSMLINFNPSDNTEPDSKMTGTNPMTRNCPRGDVFDVYAETCRQLYCPSSLQSPEDQCAPVFGTSKGVPFYAKISLEPEQTISINNTKINSTVTQLTAKLQRKLLNNSDIRVFFIGYAIRFSFDGHETHCGTTLQEVTLEIYLVSKQIMTFATFSKTFITFIENSWSLEKGDMSYGLKGKLNHNLKNGQLISIGDSQNPVNEEINAVLFHEFNSPLTVYKNIITSQTKNVLTYVIFTVLEEMDTVPSFDTFLPITYLYNCSTVILNASEYDTNGTTGAVVLHKSKICLQYNDYLRYTNGDIRVCAQVIKGNITVNHSGKTDDNININSSLYIQKIVTFVSLSISILCLMFTLLTYCLLKSLRTLPGQNNMCLSATIIIAQSLYLAQSIEIQNDIACKSMGILLHYSWLTSFFWMNVCSFHVFIVFKDVLKSRSKKGFKRLLLYIAYANFVPLLIVVGTVISSYFLSNGTSIGYGGDNCYLSSYISIGVSFALPLGLILVTNTVFFIITIVVMKNSPQLQENKEHKTSSLVYVRLSTLTGATWISGFVATWTLFDPLWYIFTILCGGQGLFIFLSFTANRRVLNKYKQLYRDCRTGKKQQNRV